MPRPRTARLRADEVNFLVYRYLQENGYSHSAYIFMLESQVNTSGIDSSQIPPGALLSFIKRGVNFMEIEEQLQGNSTDILHDTTAKCGSVSLLDLHRYMCDPAGNIHMWRKPKPKPKPEDIPTEQEFHDDDVLKLPGHSDVLYTIQWNPKCSALASIGGDNTAIMWKIPDQLPKKTAEGMEISIEHAILNQEPGTFSRSSNWDHLGSLSWSKNGVILATGSRGGAVRLWNTRAELQASSTLHKGPVFVTKWNPSSTYLVTGSTDSTVAIWDGDTGRCHKHFSFHDGVVIDIDWKNNDTFASCAADKRIIMCSLNSEFPLLTLKGHEDEINMIRFNPVGTMLASASDDTTTALWCCKSSRRIRSLTGHEREVYVLDWCPHEKRGVALATGSFDATVKLWDVNKGKCFTTFCGHNAPVYDLKYSNDGQLLASGSSDGTFVIWSARDSTVLKKFKCHPAVHEVDWNHADNKVAAGCYDGSVIVFDVRKLDRYREHTNPIDEKRSPVDE